VFYTEDSWSDNFGDLLTTDITMYHMEVEALEKKVEDEYMNARVVFFQTIALTFIYADEMKEIIDNADENHTHIIGVDVKLPESGMWKRIIHGAIDLRSVEIDKIERTVSFDLMDKLYFITLQQFGEYRNKDVDIYAGFGCNYDDDDRIKAKFYIRNNEEGLLFWREDSLGNRKDFDLTSCTLGNGEVLEFSNASSMQFHILLRRDGYTDDEGFNVWFFKTLHKTEGDDFTLIAWHYFEKGETAYEYRVYGELWQVWTGAEITGINGLYLLKGIFEQINVNATINFNGITVAEFDISLWYNYTFKLPESMKEQIKKIAEQSDVSLYVDNTGNIQIKKRYTYEGGNARSYEDAHAKESNFRRCVFDIVKRYVCKVDGNDGVVVTHVVDNPWFIRGKTEELELNYTGITRDEATLKNYADSYASNLLNFYGRRHGGYTAEIMLLKDEYFNFELYDRIGDISTGYFVYSIKFDFEKSIIILELAEINGHIPDTKAY
jgi:hypothetical protein